MSPTPFGFTFLISCMTLLSISASATKGRAWTVSPTTPPGAGPPVDPSFPGFAFEVSSFYNYALDEKGNPNEFSKTLINEVLRRTGGTPILRVGGTSGDHGSFNSSQPFPASHSATRFGPRFNKPFLVLGPSWCKAFASFPEAEFILMAPMHNLDVHNSIAMTKCALSHTKKLNALEIGNEPDFYPWFSVGEYVKRYDNFRQKLSEAIPRVANRPIFQAIDKAWTKIPLPVGAAEKAGINSTGAIKQFAYHYYQSGFEWNQGVLKNKIASHSHTVKGMAQLRPYIEYLRSNGRANVPVLMDEIGANMLQTEGHNNLATALWAVDYQLHSMTIGVSRVNWQQIVIPGFNMWQPVHSIWGPPMVRANFYSQPFIADFIGKNSPRVNEVPLPDTDTLAAYTAWENGKLVRIAIVNLELWKRGNGRRPSVQFAISGLPDRGRPASTSVLTAPEGSWANDTLRYAGMRWTHESGGKPVPSAYHRGTIAVRNNALKVCVTAGSAVLISL